MFNKSLIKKSGQMWKIYIFCICVLSNSVFLIFYLTNDNLNLYETYFLLLSIVLASLGMVYGIFFIRCPCCGIHLAQYYIGKENVNRWLISLLNCKTCPVCKGHWNKYRDGVGSRIIAYNPRPGPTLVRPGPTLVIAFQDVTAVPKCVE